MKRRRGVAFAAGMGGRRRKFRKFFRDVGRFRTFPFRVRPVLRGRRAFRRAVGVINRSARGFTGIEVKFYDQGLTNAALTTNTDASGGEHDPSATIMMNTVTQGDGESQRDGRRITMKSIYVVGNVNCVTQTLQSTADSASAIFIALVLDQQTNGATLASENVYLNPGGDIILGSQLFRNLQFTKRFRVLATRKFILQSPSITNDTGATGGVIQMGVRRNFKMFVNLGNIVVNYTGTTETVANIADNSLHLIAWCTNTGLVPRLSYSSRLRFVG